MLNENSRDNPMSDDPRETSKHQWVNLATDYLGEDRHELVAKVAYKLWEERGRPFGSPDVDWLAAERVVYSLLVASGLVRPSPNDEQHMGEKIYW